MSQPESIGVFLPNWLGDLVMATPTLRALRRQFGRDRRLVGIVRPHLADLLAGTDWLDQQWAFDPRARQPGLGRRALLGRIRRERFGLVVLLTNSTSTALLAWLGGAKRRVGYARYGRGMLLTDRLYPRRAGGRPAPAPLVETYLALAEAVGCPPESPRLELATTDAEERLADQVWQRLGLRTDGRVIALNSSGAYGAAKIWPAERFAALARRVADELDHDVLLICGPKEQQTAREIVRLAGRPRVFSLANQPLGLGTSKACIRRGRLMVSTDSGPRHVAAAFGKPVVTLLGPTLRTWIENPTVCEVFVSAEVDCLGCGQRVCPAGHHRCMRELPVEAVYAKVAGLLLQGQREKAA